MEILKDIAELQSGWNSLKESGKMTKKAICDLVIPFRDKYQLKDMEALACARNEYTIQQIYELFKDKRL